MKPEKDLTDQTRSFLNEILAQRRVDNFIQFDAFDYMAVAYTHPTAFLGTLTMIADANPDSPIATAVRKATHAFRNPEDKDDALAVAAIVVMHSHSEVANSLDKSKRDQLNNLSDTILRRLAIPVLEPLFQDGSLSPHLDSLLS